MATAVYPLVFGMSLSVSAVLLFLVQPMIGKVVLPRLGGTPAVWNTCLVFFQAILLAGYAYAHVLHKLPGNRWQLVFHVLLFGLPLVLLLPLNLHGFDYSQGDHLVLETLWLLLVLVGLPVFLVSSTAPLLQKWLVNTGHPIADDPYFLYAASNLGSLLALASYPIWVERIWPLGQQNVGWTIGYGALAMLILMCAVLTWIAPRLFARASPIVELPSEEGEQAFPIEASGRPTFLRRLRWVILAAVPASLLMGLTAALTLDISPAPLMWIAPLALYLFTFILAFARIPLWKSLPGGWTVALQLAYLAASASLLAWLWFSRTESNAWDKLTAVSFAKLTKMWFISPETPVREILSGALVVLLLLMPFRWVVFLQPLVMVVLVFLMFHVTLMATVFSRYGILTWFPFSIHLLAFFLTARLCHGALARDRPASGYLTEFYLWLAVGGVLGGMFNALVAPLVFERGLVEYPLALVLGCMLRPRWLRNGFSDWFVSRLAEADNSASQESRRRHRTLVAWAFDGLAPILAVLVTVTALSLASAPLWGPNRVSLWDWAYVREQARPNASYARLVLHYAIMVYGPPLLFCLVVMARPIRFALSLAAVLLVVAFFPAYRGQPEIVYTGRSYFGFLKVQKRMETLFDEEVITHVLEHGSTNHGMNCQKPPPGSTAKDLSRLPTTYFFPQSPAGVLLRTKFDWFRGPLNTYWADARMPASLVGLGAVPPGAGNLPVGQLVGGWSEPPVAILGLGTGTLASYGRPLQHVHFYEIDQLVIDLSLPPQGANRYFNYLEDARRRGVNIQVVLGDGRLAMQKDGPDNFYHVLFMDAFSSDSVPVHLITKDAVQMYFRKLAPGGVLCINVSNRHVSLAPVLADVAQSLGYCCLRGQDRQDRHFPSDWVMVARSCDDLPRISPRPNLSWEFLSASGRTVWTDDYSNLAEILTDPEVIAILAIMKMVLCVLLGLVVVLVLVESGVRMVGARRNPLKGCIPPRPRTPRQP